MSKVPAVVVRDMGTAPEILHHTGTEQGCAMMAGSRFPDRVHIYPTLKGTGGFTEKKFASE